MKRALLRATAFFLGVILTAFLVAPVFADTAREPALNQEQIIASSQKIFDDVSKLTGYGEQCDKTWFAAMMPDFCGRAPTVTIVELPGNIMGRYVAQVDPNTILVNRYITPGSHEWDMVLAHEFVHYMQWRAGKLHPSITCIQFAEIEKEAYDIGNQFARMRGYAEHDASFTLIGLFLRCTDGG